MSALAALLIRSFAPVLVAEARKYLATEEGKKHVADLRDAFVKAALFGDTAEPLHPEKAWDGGKNIVGEPDL